jgi:hypothetical protein
VGDGIVRLRPGEVQALEDLQRRAASAGRLEAFVPASGAATRLFASLVHLQQLGAVDLETVRAWVAAGQRDLLPGLQALEGLPGLAVWDPLARWLRGAGYEPDRVRGRVDLMLLGLLSPDALNAAELPKALIPFHRAEGGFLTAFEEHLCEAAELVRDREGRVRVHLTVSQEHRAAFQVVLDGARTVLEPRLGARFDVGFSVQDPATDTVAIEVDGGLALGGDGEVLRRPGGHGALLPNLARLRGDVVLVKNIDNVVPDRLRAEVVAWRRRLCGLLLDLEASVHDCVRRLDAGGDPGAGLAFIRERLGHEVPDGADRAWVRDALDRPLRVCGMVQNDGQPGGGPYFVAGPRGTTAQIVESAQVDPQDVAQQAVFRGATHFNPVDLALSLRDAYGQSYDLTRFTDPQAVIVTSKSHEGRTIRVLEHPGLWNGGMAGWNTVFVEIPPMTFHPVKTLADLLGPGHRYGG